MKWVIKKFNELSTEELYKILHLRSEVFVVEQECIYQDCDGKDIEAVHLFCIEEDDLLIEYFKHLNKSMYLYNYRYVGLF